MKTVPYNTAIHPAPREHLEVVRCLCRSLENGMEALVRNRGGDFRECLREQEDLCCSLRMAITKTAELMAGPEERSATHDDRLASIANSHRELATLSRRYAALLRRSARSVELLAASCGGYTANLGGAYSIRLPHSEWLAEI